MRNSRHVKIIVLRTGNGAHSHHHAGSEVKLGDGMMNSGAENWCVCWNFPGWFYFILEMCCGFLVLASAGLLMAVLN